VNDTRHSASFWFGNALLALALAILFFFGDLWQTLGVWAMVLWMGLAAGGIYLVTLDQGPASNMPD
jgi:hypothetical protein